MGNSHPGNTCTDVGMNASVLFTREERYLEEGKLEKWLVSYSVGWSMVVLVLERIYGKDGETKLLQFQVTEPGFIKFIIDRAENDLLNQIEIVGYGASYETNFVNETKNHWGGDTKTKVLYHGSENKGNLLVVEEKRKSGVEKPCAVTVAHYYAVSSRNFISRKKYDVGLSIVLDISVLNNDLDVSVRGPSQHPSSALLQMFQQVSRTWTWKWTACSHCAAEIQKRQRSGVNGQQFETETETENDDEEINYLQWPKKIGGNILANQGVIKGNNNGNLIVKQLILRRG